MSTPTTTLMLRNLPRTYTQEQLLKEIQHAVGNKVEFNFLYVPWDSRSSCNVGYAFVNCCDTEGAEWCREFFSEYYFRRSAKQKQCAVFPAHIQGLENNLIQLVGTSVGELGKYAPVIIWQGQKLRFQQVVASLYQLPDTNVGQTSSELGGGADLQPWSAAAPPWERGPARLEGLATPRPPASTPGSRSPPPVQKPPSGGSAGVASTRVPSLASLSEGRGGGSGSGMRGPGGSGGGVVEDDDFLRQLAEVTLAKRLGAAMRERRAMLPQVAPAGSPSGPPSLAELFGDGDAAPGAPAEHLRAPPGLELPRRPAPAPARWWAPPPAGGAVDGGKSLAQSSPPWEAAVGPRVIESTKNLNSRAFEKFFEKFSDHSGRRSNEHTGSSTFEERLDCSNRQPADLDFGSLKVFTL